ncbi:MAG: pantoate--beta-alanine ligase [Polaribacter sp.]|jgi:pantoate--beta-alanine ligase|uniref:pantoate--beta-alanine ligase n=1 Tax=Polaribacter sp. TaxID=1920175 RepID=UPI00384B22F8
MKIFSKKKDLKDCLLAHRSGNKTVGFVPTMGALHSGHLSLIKEAQQKNDIVVVSLFVNPTQFDSAEDLKKYPKTIKNDIELLDSVSCDILFTPSVEEIYENNISSENFNFDGLEHQMEGKFRKGHFNGVGTVVKTLFKIVAPHKAYFGQKDFQQLQIIKKMVEKHSLKVEVKGCPIFRQQDGLAMSSRNVRLSKKQKAAAPFVYKVLQEVRKKFNTQSVLEITQWVESQFKNHPSLKLEYFTVADEKSLKSIETKEDFKKYRAFIAVFADEIRLIDNLQLENL